MIPLGPIEPAGPKPRPRWPLIIASCATIAVVPFVATRWISDSKTDPLASVESATIPTELPSSEGAVKLDPSWVPKGTSAFGESDGDVLARANRRKELIPAKVYTPPPTAPVPTIPAPGVTKPARIVTTTTTAPVQTPTSKRPAATTTAAPSAPTATVPPTSPPTTNVAPSTTSGASQ